MYIDIPIYKFIGEYMQIQKISNLNNKNIQTVKTQSPILNPVSAVNYKSAGDTISFTKVKSKVPFTGFVNTTLESAEAFVNKFPEIFEGRQIKEYADNFLLINKPGMKPVVDVIKEYNELMLNEYNQIMKSANVENIDKFLKDLFIFRDKYPFYVDYYLVMLRLKPKQELLTKNFLYLEPTGLEKNPELFDFFRSGKFENGKIVEHNGEKYKINVLNEANRLDGIIADLAK